MQETDPDGQAEPTIQTIQEEQSHESTEATEDDTHSEQEQSLQVPDVMPNIAPPQGRRSGRGKTPGQDSAPRRGMGRGCAGRQSWLQTALPAGQYILNFIWNDTESDGDYRSINIPFTDVEDLREEIPLDAEPIEYFSKYLTGEVTDIICKETNRYDEQYIEANAANLRPKSSFHDCKPTNRNEIKTFLGLWILMVIVLKPKVSMFWSIDSFYLTLSLGRL